MFGHKAHSRVRLYPYDGVPEVAVVRPSGLHLSVSLSALDLILPTLPLLDGGKNVAGFHFS